MTGSQVAGPIWAKIMKRILDERPEYAREKKFIVSDDIVFRDIDSTNGLLANDETPSKYTQRNVAFRKGTEPTEISTLDPRDYSRLSSEYN